jgi:hypothetical protein
LLRRHAFVEMAGSHNQISVLLRSPVFTLLVEGHALSVQYKVNGRLYYKGYNLADGIYRQWSTLLKTIFIPQNEKESRFAKEQEACKKDVEPTFRVLQSRWAIVQHHARTWSHRTMWEVMIGCAIMHNTKRG